MLDLELRLGHFDRAAVEQVGDFALLSGKALGFLVLERAHRDHRKPRIDLYAEHGIARGSADERLFEVGMRDALISADEAGAELHADGAHLEIGCDRLSAADASSDEHRNVL